MSPIFILNVTKVLEFGAQKYDIDNWRKGLTWRSVADSIQRHFYAWLCGEDIDPESGLPHIDHIGANVMFLSEYRLTHPELDDRLKLLNDVQ